MSPHVKVFGCRPHDDGATRTGGRRPKTLEREETAGEGARSCRALELWGFESCAQSQRQAMFNGRRIQAQLGRYGTDIAKWGFELSRLM